MYIVCVFTQGVSQAEVCLNLRLWQGATANLSEERMTTANSSELMKYRKDK